MIRRADSWRDLGPGSDAASFNTFGVPLSSTSGSSYRYPSEQTEDIKKDVGRRESQNTARDVVSLKTWHETSCVSKHGTRRRVSQNTTRDVVCLKTRHETSCISKHGTRRRESQNTARDVVSLKTRHETS
ncbi:hypothetical protein Btru_027612 [Bulinus truncatus]|nr:hypothetical protein Btru_027612 [Bulinus truncatus]